MFPDSTKPLPPTHTHQVHQCRHHHHNHWLTTCVLPRCVLVLQLWGVCTPMFRMRVPGDSVRSIPKCFKIDESTLARDLTLANKSPSVWLCGGCCVCLGCVRSLCMCVVGWLCVWLCGCVAVCGFVWLCVALWLWVDLWLCMCVVCACVFGWGCAGAFVYVCVSCLICLAV